MIDEIEMARTASRVKRVLTATYQAFVLLFGSIVPFLPCSSGREVERLRRSMAQTYRLVLSYRAR